ncbi:DUF3993 domain-containing protein [Sutcliffiella cohnii]
MKSMWKKVVVFSSCIILLFVINSPRILANEYLTEEEVIHFVKNASNAQLSLTEKNRSLQEVEAILNPYFSNLYIQYFLEEHLQKERGGYRTSGTDFTIFYVPFFTYTDQTEIIYDEQESSIHIIEFFPKDLEHLSLYEDHYESITMRKMDDEWKITQYDFVYEKPAILSEPNAKKEFVKTITPFEQQTTIQSVLSLMYVPYHTAKPLLLFASGYYYNL